MNNNLSASELVLAPDGSLYHIHLKPENLADNIILVGDPNRVEMVSSFFDSIEFKASNREIVTHTGTKNGIRISAISTGMGTDNIDIVVTELDACVNINLETRKINPKHKTLNLIRLGTSGVLQENIPCNSYVASSYAVGLDGMMYFYEDNNIIDKQLTEQFINKMNWGKDLPKPYGVRCSENLLNKVAFDMISGITMTAPGFYGAQGRSIRIPLAYPEINDNFSEFKYRNNVIMNYEMETSALYALGRNLGHNVLTICAIIANRKRGEFTENYHPVMETLIKTVIDRLCK